MIAPFATGVDRIIVGAHHRRGGLARRMSVIVGQ